MAGIDIVNVYKYDTWESFKAFSVTKVESNTHCDHKPGAVSPELNNTGHNSQIVWETNQKQKPCHCLKRLIFKQ